VLRLLLQPQRLPHIFHLSNLPDSRAINEDPNGDAGNVNNTKTMSTDLTKGKNTLPIKIPTLKDLVSESETSIKENQLMVLLNQDPPENWVKEHPFIKGHKYLPIGRVEYLLRRIFTLYKIEVLKTGVIFNAIEVTVRVQVKNPITGEWISHDGVGACELQTMKDTGSLKLDMSNVNKSAVQMALPIAKSLAIKDACDHFGKLFGSNLNHKEYLDFNPLLKQSVDPEELQMLFEMKREFLTAEQINYAERVIKNKEVDSYQKLHKELQSL